MKIATVEYGGRVRAQTHRAASGETYRFSGDNTVDVENVRDAKQFEGKPNFDVQWTPLGRLALVAVEEGGDVKESLEEMGYSAKQKLAGHFDDVKGNAAEEELEEALQEKAERLQEQMETQP